jgi:hypothetical protein
MSEHVIRPDKDSEGFYTEPVTSNQNTILYTVRGREDFVDQNGCFQINYQPVEEAKTNPYVHAIRHNHRYQRVGRPTWKFINTSKNNFDQYVTFLKTKNEVFLKNAEREII